jgi:hypothetical protein
MALSFRETPQFDKIARDLIIFYVILFGLGLGLGRETEAPCRKV